MSVQFTAYISKTKNCEKNYYWAKNNINNSWLVKNIKCTLWYMPMKKKNKNLLTRKTWRTDENIAAHLPQIKLTVVVKKKKRVVPL